MKLVTCLFLALFATFQTTSAVKAWTPCSASISNDDRNSKHLAVALKPRGGGLIPAGYHPLGYAITELGEKFLEFEGSRDCDVGRFLASFKSTIKLGRKKRSSIKSEWLEMVRFSKSAEASHIYQTLDELLDFLLASGYIN